MAEAWSYLVLSDLHLSQGRSPETGCLSPNEDFLFDEEFCALIEDRLTHPRWEAHSWKLILNGDFMDLLQVTDRPGESRPDLAGSTYGLKAGPRESVWKLQRVIAGHETVFAALARFASQFPLVVIAGNHDVEWFFPEVRQAFLEGLIRRTPEEKRPTIREHVDFRSWYYFDGFLYAEHGHQYDSLNSFRFILDPRLPAKGHLEEAEQGHIDLPMGSLFVRYLFNRVETRSPFADNIKPATRFLSWLVRHQPREALHYFWREGAEVLSRVQRNWERLSPGAYDDRRLAQAAGVQQLGQELARCRPDWSPEAALDRVHRLQDLTDRSVMRQPPSLQWKLLRLLTGPRRTPLLLTLLLSIAAAGLLLWTAATLEPLFPRALVHFLERLVRPGLPWLSPLLEGLRWVVVIEFAVGLLGWVLHRRRPPGSQKQHLRTKADSIRAITQASIITMGHTHDPDVVALSGGARYFNTGAWTKTFGGEEPLLREEKELTFLQVLCLPTGAVEATLLKWESRGGCSRQVDLFEEGR